MIPKDDIINLQGILLSRIPFFIKIVYLCILFVIHISNQL